MVISTGLRIKKFNGIYKMKYYCHYTIYLPPIHIPWLMRGLGFRLPKGSIIDVVFDNPSNPDACIKEMEVQKKSHLKDFVVFCEVSTEKYRMPNTNRALERFLKSDCDIFITPQDDQKIQGYNFIDNISNLYSQEKNIGIVSGRSGFKDLSFKGMFSSSFVFNNTTKWIGSGEYKAVNLINDGPLILSKEVVEIVGLFDMNMTVFYIEVDYAFMCKKAGLQNYVLGMEIVHETWGRERSSEVYKASYGFGGKDIAYLRKKHNL